MWVRVPPPLLAARDRSIFRRISAPCEILNEFKGFGLPMAPSCRSPVGRVSNDIRCEVFLRLLFLRPTGNYSLCRCFPLHAARPRRRRLRACSHAGRPRQQESSEQRAGIRWKREDPARRERAEERRSAALRGVRGDPTSALGSCRAHFGPFPASSTPQDSSLRTGAVLPRADPRVRRG